MALEALFGPTLLKQGGQETPTAEALAGKKAIGIYFSAHWCPPCRGFTPKLAEYYTKDLQGQGMEIVFVSADKSQGEFAKYFGEQPWLALPFGKKDIDEALNKKFKVNGIPALIILDGEGNLVTKDGREAVSEDPQGKDMPWKPKAIGEILAGCKVKKPDGATVDFKEAVDGKKAVGLYFSAHWCGPCRSFTPQLAGWYKADLSKKGLEIVFVSSDKDPPAFESYSKEQPWLSLPFEDRQRKSELSKACKVQGIPSLVIIDPKDFSVINADGRSAVSVDPQGDELPWTPKPFNDLGGGPGKLSEVPSIVVLCEDAPAEEQEAIVQALSAVGQRYRAKAKAAGEDEPEFEMHVSKAGGGLPDRLRELMALPVRADGGSVALPKVMALVDIPSDGAFYLAADGPITEASIAAFIAAFQAGKLERKQLQR